MTISGGGLNINFTPMPTIFEKETTGQAAQKNAGEVRGNVSILPQSQADDIPFTKLDDHNKWDYRSEPERPSLMPNSILRGAGAEIRNTDEGWKAQLESLYEQLPDDVKLELAGLPTVYTAALKFVLDLAANALNWQEKADLASKTENALNRTIENKNFPEKSYLGSLEIGTEMAALNEKWVKEIGQNDPGFIEAMEFLEDTRKLLKGTTYDANRN